MDLISLIRLSTKYAHSFSHRNFVRLQICSSMIGTPLATKRTWPKQIRKANECKAAKRKLCMTEFSSRQSCTSCTQGRRARSRSSPFARGTDRANKVCAYGQRKISSVTSSVVIISTNLALSVLSGIQKCNFEPLNLISMEIYPVPSHSSHVHGIVWMVKIASLHLCTHLVLALIDRGCFVGTV